MPDTIIITPENAVNRATLMLANLTGSKLRLVQNYTPNPTTTRDELIAAEATFSGYPAGGYATGTWTGPGIPSIGGAVLTSGVIVVVVTGEPPYTPNPNISGWWLETSGETPVTLLTGTFDPNRLATVPLDQFPLIIQDFEGLAYPQPASA
jgi:hypothetical protein